MNTIRKSYTSISELPTQVKFSFDERDQKKWMKAYNDAIGDSDDEESVAEARRIAWMSMVDAPSSLAVETWASVEVRDADGELVPISTIADHSDHFIDAGGLMHDSHTNVPVGTAWAWETRKHPETGEDGIVYYFNLYRGSDVFDHARDDIINGRKTAVSIGAEAPRGGYKCDERGCYVERDVTDLYEISICETPANPHAYFINVGKDIAKSKYDGEVLRLHVRDIDVHQDYTTCPLQFAKHLLLGITPNVHIKDAHMVIAKARGRETEMIRTILDTGYPFRYNLSKSQLEVIPDYTIDDAIEEALSNDWACNDAVGHILLTKKIPKEVFIDWYERGYIHKFGEMWGMSSDDIVKESGSMGCGCTGSSNTVYGSNPQRRRKRKPMSKARKCPDGYHMAPDGLCRLLDVYGKPTGATPEESRANAKPRKKPKNPEPDSNGGQSQSKPQTAPTPKRKVDTAKVGFVTVPKGTKGYKIVQNLKLGDSKEARASREALVNYYIKNGYIPMIDIKPFEINGRTFDGKTTTYTMFTDKNGNYTPERKKVHDKIVFELLGRMKKADGRKPIVAFTGGGSASGKGSLDETLAEYLQINQKVNRKSTETDEEYKKRKDKAYSKLMEGYKIDPDAIMAMLPEYHEYIAHDMIGGASVFHQEGSDIAKRVFELAVKMGYDFVYDGTFSSKKAVGMAKSIDPDTYDKFLVGKLTDVDICQVRSGKRFINGGKGGMEPRIVPNKILVKSNGGFRKVIKTNDMDSIFNAWTTIEDDENKKKTKKYVRR